MSLVWLQHCRVFLDGVPIGEHCGSYSEWWLDVPPATPAALAAAASGRGAGRGSAVSRELVVAVTTTFNYTQCELVRGGEGFFLFSGITRSVAWHGLVPGTPLAIHRAEIWDPNRPFKKERGEGGGVSCLILMILFLKL